MTLSREKIIERGKDLAFDLFGGKIKSREDMVFIYNLYVNDLDKLIEHYNRPTIEDGEYYSMISYLWLMEENATEWWESWYYLLKPSMFNGKLLRDTHMDFMMDNDELKVFNDLPNKFTVYRGIAYVTEEEDQERHMNDLGIFEEDYGRNEWESFSWTLSKEKAEWFANRGKLKLGFYESAKSEVLELEVYKDVDYPTLEEDKPKAIAYINGRQEQEILVYNHGVTFQSSFPENLESKWGYDYSIPPFEELKSMGEFYALEGGEEQIDEWYEEQDG